MRQIIKSLFVLLFVAMTLTSDSTISLAMKESSVTPLTSVRRTVSVTKSATSTPSTEGIMMPIRLASWLKGRNEKRL